MPVSLRRFLAPLIVVIVLAVGFTTTLIVLPHHVKASPLSAPPITANGNGLGAPGVYTFYSQNINAFKQLQVNVANGNLVIHARDLHITGTGIDLELDSTYNNLAGVTGRLGQNWVLGTGGDVRLAPVAGGVDYYRADGYAALFATNGSGYTNAPNLNATLVKKGDGTYTLTFHRTGEVQIFSTSGQLTADQDKNGNAIHFAYDTSSGRLTTITDTQSRQVTLSYDATNTYVTGFKDSTNRGPEYHLDSHNNMTSTSDAEGKSTYYGYTGSDLTTITDPNTNVTQISYDTSHRVTQIIAPDTGKTTFTYNATNTVLTDNYSNQTTYTYNTQLPNEIASVKDAHGHTQASTYTPNGDVLTTTDALQNQSTFGYDTNNNITSVQDAYQTQVGKFTYQAPNQVYLPDSSTDAQGNLTAYTYDTPGNLKSITDTKTAQTTNVAYNTNGTIASVTDANNHQTTYGYDSLGNLKTVTPPSPLGAIAITVDSLSRVQTVTDGKGQKTTYSYDRLDRLDEIDYQGGSKVAYTYDTNSNALTVTDLTGTTTLTYDGLNRTKTKTLPNGETFGYNYDKNGNMVLLKVGSCASCTPTAEQYYSYNGVNLLQAMGTQNPSTNLQTQLAAYTYDNANRRLTTGYANGVTLTTGYDNDGHETSVAATNASHATLTSYAYSYAKPGTSTALALRYSVTDAANNVTAYTYDEQNRLLEAKTTNGGTTKSDYQYTYDGASNRLTATANGTQTTATYNAADELTKSVTGGTTVTYSYDGNGNRTGASTGQAFGYNSVDQTTSFTPAGQSAISASYAGSDQTERAQFGSATDASNALGLYSDGTGTFIRDSQGQLVADQISGSTYYYLLDGLGSVVGLTNGTGTQVASYQYDPYGNPTSTTGTTYNPYRYAGGYQDSQTGLYHFGQRYDDPSSGTWTQRDPLAGVLNNPTTMNRYVYADGNPSNLVDPTGGSALGCGLAVASVGVDLAGDALGPAGILLGAGLAAAGTTVSVADNPSPLNGFASFTQLVVGQNFAGFSLAYHSITYVATAFDAVGAVLACTSS